MIRRRTFLRTSAIASGALLLPSGFLSACRPANQLYDKVGLILGTIRDEMKQDYKKALEKVAEFGYTYLEFGNYYGPSKQEFMELLDSLGLIPLAGGTSMATLVEEEKLKKLIEENLSMGKKYLVCYWPWLTSGEDLDLDEIKLAAENLEKVGETCHREGIRFAFHNHDKEFQDIEGTISYDYILEQTTPENVTMEIDLYWIRKGNGDPVDYFRKYPGRFELAHVKDMDNTPERSFACVGDGIIDFKAIFSHAGTAGLKYLIVEHDRPENPMECIRTSIQYLKSLRA